MKVSCPKCRKTLNAPDSMAGRKVKCPGCQGVLLLPGSVGKPAASAPAASQPEPTDELSEARSEGGGEAKSPPGKTRMLILAIILFVQGGLGAMAPLMASVVASQGPQAEIPKLSGQQLLNAMLLAAASLGLGGLAIHGKQWVNWAAVALAAGLVGNAIFGVLAVGDQPGMSGPVAASALIAPVLIQTAIAAFAISNIRRLKVRLGMEAVSAMVVVVVLFGVTWLMR